MERLFSWFFLLLCPMFARFGPVSGSASSLEAVYRDVVGVVSPGQQHLTEEAVGSLFKTLSHRVQCGVPCGKVGLYNRPALRAGDSRQSPNSAGRAEVEVQQL